MRNIFQQYRLLFFLGVGLCIFAVAALLISRGFSSTDTPEQDFITTSEQTEADLSVRRVFVKDLDTYISIDSHDTDDHDTIENTLYTYVSQGQPGLYTGTIRPGSYKSIGDTRSEILVDIEPAQTSYKLILLNVEGAKSKVISAVCASQDEQMKQDAKCLDGGNP